MVGHEESAVAWEGGSRAQNSQPSKAFRWDQGVAGAPCAEMEMPAEL